MDKVRVVVILSHFLFALLSRERGGCGGGSVHLVTWARLLTAALQVLAESLRSPRIWFIRRNGLGDTLQRGRDGRLGSPESRGLPAPPENGFSRGSEAVSEPPEDALLLWEGVRRVMCCHG